jgi:hypothetical protein
MKTMHTTLAMKLLHNSRLFHLLSPLQSAILADVDRQLADYTPDTAPSRNEESDVQMTDEDANLLERMDTNVRTILAGAHPPFTRLTPLWVTICHHPHSWMQTSPPTSLKSMRIITPIQAVWTRSLNLWQNTVPRRPTMSPSHRYRTAPPLTTTLPTLYLPRLSLRLARLYPRR